MNIIISARKSKGQNKTGEYPILFSIDSNVSNKNDMRTIKVITASDKEDYYKLLPKPYTENSKEYVAQDIPVNMISHVFRVQASKFLF